MIVRQGPDGEALDAALGEIAPRRREQPATEAEALEFRPEIKLVDFAVIGQAARPVPPVIGIARNGVAERQDRNTAALADSAFPPLRSAPVDQLVKLRPGDDASVCGAPRLIMGRRQRSSVG